MEKPKYYHGTSTSFDKLLQPYDVGSDKNSFGEGLYTSSSIDKAMGYTKKGKGKTPGIFEIDPQVEVKPYNMHQEMTPELKEHIRNLLSPYEGEHIMESENAPSTLFDALNEIRNESRNLNMPTYDYQDFVDGVKDHIRKQGYNALEHEGGILTKSEPHKVTIFDNPVQDVTAKRIKQPAVADIEGGYSEPVTKFTNWNGEMGKTTTGALADYALLEGIRRAAEVPEVGTGSDIIPEDDYLSPRFKKIKSIMENK